MPLPLLTPLRDLVAAHVGDAQRRVVSGIATAVLAIVATALLVAAGLAALASVIGFPLAAFVFSALFAFLALVVHLLGRRIAARRAAQIAAARNDAKADMAMAAALARSSGPLLPLAAFIAAFVLSRRP